MAFSVQVQLDTARLTKLGEDAQRKAESILDAAAIRIQARAIQNTVRVDTGAMKNGWRVENTGPFQRTIYNTQEYAIYNELGTVKMAATPMLVPAVEEEREKLAAEWAGLFE